jgi:hypothetical protein
LLSPPSLKSKNNQSAPSIHLMKAISMCLGTSQTQLNYLLIIKSAKCFDHLGSSSGLHYEPVTVRKLLTSLGSQKCLQKIKVRSLCLMSSDTKLLFLCTQLFNINWFVVKA